MISAIDWSEIQVLARRDGLSQREIARRLGISRGTVKRALAAERPPKYERAAAPTSFDPFETRVLALLRDHPLMPVTVIAERVGWPGGASTLRRHVSRLRPLLAPVDPADRLSYSLGDQGQCDLWFPAVKIPLSDGSLVTLPVLVMVSSASRFITALMLPSRMTGDLIAGTWELLNDFGGVPHRLVWDNEAGIGRRGVLTRDVAFFAGAVATRIVQLKPCDPESKGIVERANRFLETSFLSGRVFTSPQDFNNQLQAWLVSANHRLPRALGQRPVDAILADRAAMGALPPVAPVTSRINTVRLARDYYVRAGSNDYSVDPRFIGRMVHVHMNLSHVWVITDGIEVGRHQRFWGKTATITDPDHVALAATLRRQFNQPRRVHPGSELVRDLGDYDRAFGVSFDPPQPLPPTGEFASVKESA